MPFYDYAHHNKDAKYCVHTEEIFGSIKNETIDEIDCPVCSKTLYKTVAGTSFILKGKGWERDGYGS